MSELLFDDYDYYCDDDDSSFESEGGTRDVPRIVREELERRSCLCRAAQQNDSTKVGAQVEFELGPASPEIVEAFKDHVREGHFGPQMRGGYLDIMERLGVTPKSTDPFVTDMKHNIWSFSLPGMWSEDEERQNWQDLERKYRARVRYLRYREFIERQKDRNQGEGDQFSSILSTKDCFWSHEENGKVYTGPDVSEEEIRLEEEKLSPEILERDEELTDDLLIKLGPAFTWGLWYYLNADKVFLGMGAGVNEVGTPGGINLSDQLKFLTCELSEHKIYEQCKELTTRYTTLQRPLGQALQKDEQEKNGQKSRGNNKKKGKNKKKNKPFQQSHQSHEEAIQKHLSNLISLLENSKDSTLAFARLCVNITDLLTHGVIYDPAFSQTILCYKSGSIMKSLLRLRHFASKCAKDADEDLQRLSTCGSLWWFLYSRLTGMVSESIAQLGATGKTDEGGEIASERFKNDFLPELLMNVKSDDNNVWYSEERAVWTALEVSLVRLPEKNAIKFIKEYWNLLEFACLRNFDDDIQKASFTCERVRARESFMAPRASAEAVSLINALCNFGMMEAGNNIIPGPLAIKMLKKGVVSVLIKCCNDSKDFELSALAMSGLAQMSRVKDCRRLILQQPNNEGLALVKKGLTCNHANNASAAMLLTLHLAWDEEWRDSLRKIKPGIEKLCIKIATFSMESILKKAEILRFAERKSQESVNKEMVASFKSKFNEDSKDIDKASFRLEEEKGRNEKIVKWTDIETHERAGIVNYTLSRSILLLSSALLVQQDFFHRLQETDALFLISACNDILIDDARNATASLLNNYNMMSKGGSTNPSQFPDPSHLLLGFIEHLKKAADENITPGHLHVVVLVLGKFYRSPKWKKYFKKLRNENEDAKFFIDNMIARMFYEDATNCSSQVDSRTKSGVQTDNIHEKCSTLVLASCTNCGKVEEKRGEFKSCARCQTVKYCGRACQKVDWKVHKKVCKSLGH